MTDSNALQRPNIATRMYVDLGMTGCLTSTYPVSSWSCLLRTINVPVVGQRTIL